MKRNPFKSIKTKLVLLITLVISLISLFVFIYIPNSIEQQQIKSIGLRVEALTKIASYSVATAIYFDDVDAIKDQINALVLSENIEYIVIQTPKNSAYYQYNYPSAVIEKYLDLNVKAISENNTVYRTKKNIELNNQLIGTLFLGYSLKELNDEINSLQSKIAYVSIIIFLIGLIAVYYIGSYITKPITKMVDAVEEIRGGDLTKRANVISEDEIGYLSKSFNLMIDRIEDSNEEMETINKDLEIIVADRTKELTESEERFRSLYEHSTIGIYRTAPSGKIVLANPALVNMLGYKSFDSLFKSHNVADGYVDSKGRQKFLKKIQSKGVVSGLEQKWKKSNGEIIYIRESARAIENENGDIIYFDGTVEDITAKKIIDEELIQAKEKAEASVRMKTEFLAQMSHEIRTPINSIMSYSQLLKDEIIDLVPEELKFSFDMINNGGRRLIRTVDLILNASELQTGTYEPIIEECNVVEILEQLVGEFQTAANSKKLDMMFLNRLDQEELLISADIYTITQIFANLIDNAIKYTNNGSIEVVAYKNNENKLCVDFQDTGIGISQKFQETLFEPFTQEEQGYTRKFDGNGLGMALVKEYCKLNNAKISLVSAKDKGSTFTVVFNNTDIKSEVYLNDSKPSELIIT